MKMEKTKWIVAIFFALLSGYFLVQSITGVIIGDEAAGFYIKMLIGTAILEIMSLIGFGLVEEKEKKPRERSLFFFLHLIQMVIVVFFMIYSVYEGFEDKIHIISFLIQALLLLWYGQTMQKVLEQTTYPRSLWIKETSIFYISVMSFMVFSNAYVLETFFSIDNETVIYGLFFYQIITWMIKQCFPKIATFMYGAAITGMLLLSVIVLLWVFLFENLM